MKASRSGSLSDPRLALSGVGMLIGGAIDASQGGFMLLASLCANPGALGFGDVLRLHWLCLPFMHVGMVLGSLLGTAYFVLPSLCKLKSATSAFIPGVACTLFMLLGMSLGSYLWLQTGLRLPKIPDEAFMLAAMWVGMAAAMQAWGWSTTP